MMDGLVLDTNNRCFICSDPAKVTSSPSASSVKYNSLDNLSRYLKLNLKSVFTEEGSVLPPHILASLKQTSLKVELCEECGGINEVVSKLCQKLEKIEMELSSCVSRIHEKLINSADIKEEDDNTEKSVNSMDLGDNDKTTPNGESGVTAKLRAEVVQKCSHTVVNSRPIVKIQRMTMPQMNANNRRSMSRLIGPMRFKNRQKPNTDSNHPTLPIPEVETGLVKVEGMSDQDPFQEDGDDMGNLFLDPEVDDDDDHFPNNEDYQSNQLQTASGTAPQIASGGSRRKCKLQLRKDFGDDDPAPFITNSPETGADKVQLPCKFCPKVFKWRANLQKHMSLVHPKLLKYPCTFCEKTFELKSDLKKHREKEHIHVNSKCKHCDKVFANIISLKMHENNVCSQRPSEPSVAHPIRCQQCGDTFSSSFYLRLHSITVHSEHKCDLCDMKFAKRWNLTVHRRNH